MSSIPEMRWFSFGEWDYQNLFWICVVIILLCIFRILIYVFRSEKQVQPSKTIIAKHGGIAIGSLSNNKVSFVNFFNSHYDTEIRILKSRASDAMNNGDIIKAKTLLTKVGHMEEQMLNYLAVAMAETCALRGEVALNTSAYNEAAEHFAAAAATVPTQLQELRLRYLEREASCRLQRGKNSSHNSTI